MSGGDFITEAVEGGGSGLLFVVLVGAGILLVVAAVLLGSDLGAQHLPSIFGQPGAKP